MANKTPLMMVAHLLVVIGGLNWGLVGIAGLAGGGNYNVVNLLLGGWPMVESLVYLLVGISAVIVAAQCCKACKA